MIPLLDLWLPIVVAAVAVFLVSSVLHMALTYHRRDYRQLPREAETLDLLRGLGLSPGLYFFPYAPSHKEMGSPEMVEKRRRGPVGLLVAMPAGPPQMGKYLGLWLGFCVLVGVLVAWLAGRALVPGALARAVFCFTATAAFLGYGVGQIMDSIWKGHPWSNTLRALLDALVYSLVTAGVFAWLWPR